MRCVFILAAAGLVAGCASPPPRNDLVVLLPEQDGKLGAVVVDDGKRETVLHTSYASVRSEKDGLQAAPSSAEQVRQSFGPALAAQPARPVSLTLYFIEGNTLSDESKVVVDRMFAEIAKRPTAEITVIGHTDTVGADAFNDNLSLERAQTVREILIGMGMPAQNITATGRGKRELLVPTDDNVNEPRNRRVEISVR